MTSTEYRRTLEKFERRLQELKKDIQFFEEKENVWKQLNNLNIQDRVFMRKLPQTRYPLQRIQPQSAEYVSAVENKFCTFNCNNK